MGQLFPLRKSRVKVYPSVMLHGTLTLALISALTNNGAFAASSPTTGGGQSGSSSLTDWLNYSFQSNSIAWFLISSFLGGIAGASFKFIFETILPSRLKDKKEIVAVARKYSVPILISAEALRNRFDNIIRLHETIETNKWLSYKENPGYYYLSTLFLVGRFFGWVEILRSTVVYLDLSSVRETRTFEKFLSAIESAFSSAK
jgi:hypothetical protein